MKYCSHCGAQLDDEAIVCIHCGCSAENKPVSNGKKDDTLPTIAKVFMILGCVSTGWLLISLAWLIPITSKVFDKLKTGEEISTGLKVAVLLLVSPVAGIILFCMNM